MRAKYKQLQSRCLSIRERDKAHIASYLTLCPHITLLYSYFPLYYALLTCYYLNISDCTVEEASTAQMYYIFTLKTRHFKQIVGSCLIRLFVTLNCHKPLFLILFLYFSIHLQPIGHMFPCSYDHQLLTIFSCLVSNSALYKELSFSVLINYQ